MKTFNAYKTFFSALVVSGFVLLGILRAVLGAGTSNSLLLSHFTVIFLVFVIPLCILFTRLQAMRNGRGFFPKERERKKFHPSPPVRKRKGKNFLYLNDPLSGAFGTGLIMGWDIRDSPIKKKKKHK